MNTTIEQTILAELCEVRAELRDVKLAISGDPTDVAKPGIMTRLDRLEQQMAALQWFTRSVVGAAVTIVLGSVLGFWLGRV